MNVLWRCVGRPGAPNAFRYEGWVASQHWPRLAPVQSDEFVTQMDKSGQRSLTLN